MGGGDGVVVGVGEGGGGGRVWRGGGRRGNAYRRLSRGILDSLLLTNLWTRLQRARAKDASAGKVVRYETSKRVRGC